MFLMDPKLPDTVWIAVSGMLIVLIREVGQCIQLYIRAKFQYKNGEKK